MVTKLKRLKQPMAAHFNLGNHTITNMNVREAGKRQLKIQEAIDVYFACMQLVLSLILTDYNFIS